MALAQLRLPGGVHRGFMRAALLVACAATAAASDVGAMQGFGRTSLGDTDKSILMSLKQLYAAKLRPLEAKGKFHEIGGQPALSDAWFDSKPIVLLIGQYSVGKTSFIRYLLGRDFPGQRVGPEPTTDRFVAIMHGDADKVTPGNALTAQSDAPFSPLKRFGTQFLNRFEAAQLTSPILKRCVLVDSPGVLSGDKQKNRGYDYDAVVQWWVQHADRILLLFDAHKLDMSDEFKAIVNMLGEHAGKARRAAPRRAILLGAQFWGAQFGAIFPTAASSSSQVRVVLNKADAVPAQNLMRVYGALMWMLGGVVASPEVPRVYIGSFWDKPFINAEMAELMEMEEGDLIEDLATLPQNNVMSKINEVCRRCRQVETHVHILACLRARVAGTMFGRAKLQQQLLTEQGMASVFNEVRRKHDLSKGDFPDWQFMARQLQGYDFTEFYKPSKERSQKLKKVCRAALPRNSAAQRAIRRLPCNSSARNSSTALTRVAPPRLSGARADRR